MVNFIAFSDLHVHNYLDCASPAKGGLTSRAIDCLNVLEQIHVAGEKYNVDGYIFGGDLVHVSARLDTPVYNAVAKILVAMAGEGNRPVHLIVGNHDQLEKAGEHALEILNHIPGIIIHDTYEPFNLVSKTGSHQQWFFACPYRDYADDVHKGLTKCNQFAQETENVIAVIHQGVRDVPINSSGYEKQDDILGPSDLPKKTKYNLLGHYHRHSNVNNNSMFLGSPLQHTWGDVGVTKFFWYFKDDGIVQAECSQSPQFLKYTYADFLKLQAGDPCNKFNFVKVIGVPEKDADKVRRNLRDQGTRWVTIEDEDFTHEPEDLQALPLPDIRLSSKEAVKEYVEAVDTGSLDKAQLISLGIQTLEDVQCA